MCYVSLICYFKATTVANFIWIGFEWFEIYCKTKRGVFSWTQCITVCADYGEIWHGRLHQGPALACQIWPISVMVVVEEPPDLKVW